MKTLKITLLCSLMSVGMLSGCTTYDQPRREVRSERVVTRDEVRVGNVSDIQVISVSKRTSGGGAILGAIVGGALGNQVGKGDGRKAATVVGAVGGAVAGNAIEKRSRRDDEVFRVTIRFDNGMSAQYDYQDINDLQVGDRVQVINGMIHRF